MDSELKTRWIEALRSGNYTKGLGQLRQGNTYCCLGVLADVAGCNWNGPIAIHPGKPNLSSMIGLMNWGLITMEDSQVLIEMNDSGQTFDDIADWIEGNIT